MNLRNLINSEPGKIIISIILGLGLATIFRRVCKGRECLAFHAAPMEKIKDQIFKFNNKCYTFNEKAVSCDKNKKILKFA
jgi:hypothetical protein|tara:strand:- start:948 stop:1187 length:240 start_codon:yes stop_codon:yes gene_type:complete